MQITLNEVKQAITTLPSEERKELLDWLNKEEKKKVKKRRV